MNAGFRLSRKSVPSSEGRSRKGRGSAARPGPSGRSLARQERQLAYAFIFPSFFLIALLYLVPTIVTLLVSFQSSRADPNIIRAFSAENLSQLSLDNYRRAFQDPIWLKASVNTAWYSAVVVVLTISLSMALALVLNQSFKGRGFLRALVLIPWAVPGVVNGTTWGLVFHADIGTMNGVLKTLGIIRQDLLWLGHPQLALVAIIVASTWQLLPFTTLFFLAGLQAIPREIYESAEIDGANVVQRFLYITLPSIKIVLLTVLTLLIVSTTRAFDVIWSLTSGGPAYGTTVMNLWVYRQSFDFMRFGYGSALAYILMSISGIIVLANLLLRRGEES